MQAAFIPINIIPMETKNDVTIQISYPLLEQLKLKKNKEIKIWLGKKNLSVKIQIVKNTQNEIHFPKPIYHYFSLPIQTYPFRARYLKETNCLHLGPVVGLLTDFISDTDTPNFRNIHLFCEELHQGLSELGGFFYVFTYKNFSGTEVSGYYKENGKWVFSELPYPDVIYNRIHSRKLEQVKSFLNFRKKLEQCNIPFFNDRFLSKWEVHEKLLQDDTICPFIPETQIYTNESLVNFIGKYNTIFIKPIHGSQGKNIIKLGKEMDQYVFQSTLNVISDKIIKKLSLDEIFHQLNLLLRNKIYIIQQGIPLATHEAKTIDFRVLCHTNQNHLWDVTSIVARISGESQFVSNIAQGGKTTNALTTLRLLFDKKKAKEIILQMKKLSIEAAEFISSHSEGIIGELGIDIGVDQSGKVWLIEINSKPSKNFTDNTVKIRPSAKAILQFCTKLAFDALQVKEESSLD